MTSYSHGWALRRVLDELRSRNDNGDPTAATMGLYGLRVLASCPGLFSWTGKDHARRWRALKRKTSGLAIALHEEFAYLQRALKVSAMQYRPNYAAFSDESLARSLLILDRTESFGVNDELWLLVENVYYLFHMQNRLEAGPQLPENDLLSLSVLGPSLLAAGQSLKPLSIYDPSCGVGEYLKELFSRLKSRGVGAENIEIYGQDASKRSLFIGAWQLLFRGAQKIELAHGDPVVEPYFRDGRSLKRFDLIITQPPVYYSAKKALGRDDPFFRFRFGDVQRHRADFAFVQHVAASLQPDGRAALFVPVSILARRGGEDEIRAGMVHADIVSTCVSFQGGLLLQRQTPAAILLLDLGKPPKNHDSIFFADVPLDASPYAETPSPAIEAMKPIVKLVLTQQEEPGISRRVTLEELKDRDYSLSPHTYIKRRGPKQIDITLINEMLSSEKAKVQEALDQFDEHLNEAQKLRLENDE